MATREQELVDIRRGAWKDWEAPRVIAGLALSGGGIRSATFCLGFIQALAKAKVLRGFDFLSTVSGGGYVGSFLGAWIHNTRSASQVETQLPDSESPPVRFLRNNGRYLAPNGAGDAFAALAAHVRSLFTVWLVLGICTLGLLFLAEAVKISHWYEEWLMSFNRVEPPKEGSLWEIFKAAVRPSPFFYTAGWSLLTLALPPLLAYWFVNRLKHLIPIWSVLIGIGVALAYAFSHGMPAGWARANVWPLVAWSYLATLGLAVYATFQARKQDVGRNRLNDILTAALFCVAATLALAIVDTIGQSLSTGGVWSGAVLPLLAAGAQWLLPRLAESTDKKKIPTWLSALFLPAVALVVALLALGLLSMLAHSLSLEIILNPKLLFKGYVRVALGSLFLLAGVFAFKVRNSKATLAVIIVVVAWVASDRIQEGEVPGQIQGFAALAAGLVALALGAAIGFSFHFVNLSSHHRLYATRLTRTYLGASNPARTNPGPRRAFSKDPRDVTTAVDGDNIDFTDYCPPVHGGPLHIINSTVNETVDGISQIEQRDRRGFSLAVGPAGMSARVGDHALFKTDPLTGKPESPRAGRVWLYGGPVDKFHTLAVEDSPRVNAEMPTLGSWVGISGAAFTTGLGARTNLAISFLLGFFNVRLGYWWDSGVLPWARPGRARRGGALAGDFFSQVFPAQAGLFEEFMARFHGASREHWYLSDGGHFENCAVYELIRRRVPLIVCCDCGADPKYQFEDVANLVRKARIDFGAEIEFWSAAEIANSLPSFTSVIGELAELRPNKKEPDKGCSARQAAIAWVKYSGGRDRSVLLIVKPSFGKNAPLDVLHYDATNRGFPQQSTLDQFFDEAQWESYREAGFLLGEKLFTADPNQAVVRWSALAAAAMSQHSSPRALKAVV